jgi:hypothetical protein
MGCHRVSARQTPRLLMDNSLEAAFYAVVHKPGGLGGLLGLGKGLDARDVATLDQLYRRCAPRVGEGHSLSTPAWSTWGGDVEGLVPPGADATAGPGSRRGAGRSGDARTGGARVRSGSPTNLLPHAHTHARSYTTERKEELQRLGSSPLHKLIAGSPSSLSTSPRALQHARSVRVSALAAHSCMASSDPPPCRACDGDSTLTARSPPATPAPHFSPPPPPAAARSCSLPGVLAYR